MKKTSLVWVLARLLAGFILAYAGFSKLLEPAANFEAALSKYGVYPPSWIPWMAGGIPWIEWFVGCFLLLGYAPRLVTGIASILLMGFIITLGSSPLFLEAGGSDCGCFGHSGLHLSLRQIFLVDLGLFLVCLRLLFLKDFPFTFHSILLKRRGREDDKLHSAKGAKLMKTKIMFFCVCFLMSTALLPREASADAGTKLGRGLANIGFGWFEIVNEIGNESDRHGPHIGFPSGLVRGTAFGIVRTLAGVLEVITFPFPNGPDKGYDPIVLPAFVFDRR